MAGAWRWFWLLFLGLALQARAGLLPSLPKFKQAMKEMTDFVFAQPPDRQPPMNPEMPPPPTRDQLEKRIQHYQRAHLGLLPNNPIMAAQVKDAKLDEQEPPEFIFVTEQMLEAGARMSLPKSYQVAPPKRPKEREPTPEELQQTDKLFQQIQQTRKQQLAAEGQKQKHRQKAKVTARWLPEVPSWFTYRVFYTKQYDGYRDNLNIPPPPPPPPPEKMLTSKLEVRKPVAPEALYGKLIMTTGSCIGAIVDKRTVWTSRSCIVQGQNPDNLDPNRMTEAAIRNMHKRNPIQFIPFMKGSLAHQKPEDVALVKQVVFITQKAKDRKFPGVNNDVERVMCSKYMDDWALVTIDKEFEMSQRYPGLGFDYILPVTDPSYWPEDRDFLWSGWFYSGNYMDFQGFFHWFERQFVQGYVKAWTKPQYLYCGGDGPIFTDAQLTFGTAGTLLSYLAESVTGQLSPYAAGSANAAFANSKSGSVLGSFSGGSALTKIHTLLSNFVEWVEKNGRQNEAWGDGLQDYAKQQFR